MRWAGHIASMEEKRNKLGSSYGKYGGKEEEAGQVMWQVWRKRGMSWAGHMASTEEKRNEVGRSYGKYGGKEE